MIENGWAIMYKEVKISDIKWRASRVGYILSFTVLANNELFIS